MVPSIDMGNNINVYKKSITFDNETKKKITNCIAQKLPSPIEASRIGLIKQCINKWRRQNNIKQQ